MFSELTGIDVLFIAGFGPITRDVQAGEQFYVRTLGLPLKGMEGNSDYMLTKEGEKIEGVKHFALWPLYQAALSCFGDRVWPQDIPLPQAWIEFEVDNIETATAFLQEKGYHLLVACREEPWGQTVTRLLSPEGLLAGVTVTPWLRTGGR